MHVGTPRTTTIRSAAADSIGHLGSGIAGAVPRAFGVALGLMFQPLRLLAGMSLMGIAAKPQPSEYLLDIINFRVRTAAGQTAECVLRGENRSGELTLGDRVRVHGRRGWRAGHLITVSRVCNLDTGVVIRPRVPFAVRYALPIAVAKLAVGVLILLLLLAMCGVIK